VEGFTAALKAAGLPVDDRCIAFTDHQPMYGVLRRLVNDFNPTAIFVAGEDMGLEASYILRDVLGLKIPQDVSLLGMESAKVSQFLAPPMTTLCQPLEELARRSMDLLLHRIGARLGKPEQIILDSTLIERESVAAVSNAVAR
jgi:DNA-binding LacI/PurR family transcriptional regulator